MKLYFAIFLFTFFSMHLLSQENLVPNGNFEEVDYNSILQFEKIDNENSILYQEINNNSKDSIQFIDKLFSRRHSKHQFVIDTELGMRVFSYGLNYYFRKNSLGIGFRIAYDRYTSFQSLNYGTKMLCALNL